MPFRSLRSLPLLLTLLTAPATAQITPDHTLNTQVEAQGNTITITGGTTAGGNLFHSFSEFSIPVGGDAFFHHGPTLTNVISRVTGGNVSDIQGSLRTVGTANFFLINPAGIVFGEGAALNVGGSFFATTGDRLLFADGFALEATATTPPPLLSMSVPVGLQTGLNPGPITNRSRTLNPMGMVVGLQVPPAQALVLVGGDINLEGGLISSFSGSVALGSVGSNSTVGFMPTAAGFMLDTSTVTGFSDISLISQAGIDTSGPRSGGIELHGDQLQLRDRSTITGTTVGALDGGAIALRGRQIFVDGTSSILASTVGTGNGADITVQGTESIDLMGAGYAILLQDVLSQITGQPPPIEATDAINTASFGDGNSGDVTLLTQWLRVVDGATLGSSTGGRGRAGDLIVRASDGIEAVGALFGSVNLPGSFGDGGSVVIESPNVILQDGTLISGTSISAGRGGTIAITADRVELSDSRSTFPPIPPVEVLRTVALTSISSVALGTGSGGDITVNARIVELSGGSNIRTNSIVDLTEFAGASGRITINASDRLVVEGVSVGDGFPSIINTATDTRSPANDIVLNVGELLLRDGGILESGTSGIAAAGQIRINASDRIEVTGSGFSPFLQTVRPSSISSASFSNPINPFPASGDAGNITITAPALTLGDGGTITVSSTALGRAGNVDLTVDTLDLDGRGSINGSTVGGDGGQLLLKVRDRLTLRNQSEIISTAGASAIGQSGNIQITGGSLTLKNSTLSANSNSPNSQGGSIAIALADTFTSENSTIAATTTSTNGGDIQIRADKGFFLRENSLISTTAGLAGTGGNGGNIQITSPVVIALAQENSDITADAFRGNGGNIQINADTLLGLTPRPELTESSDITASSALGISGTISITEFDLSPDNGLRSLAPVFVDPNSQIALGCATQNSEFVASGRGGLVLDPNQQTQSDRPWQDLRDLSRFRSVTPPSPALSSIPAPGPQPQLQSQIPSQISSQIVEATGWQQLQRGNIALLNEAIAHNPGQNQQRPCPSSASPA